MLYNEQNKPLFVYMHPVLKAQELIVIITTTIVSNYTSSHFTGAKIAEIMQNKKRKLKHFQSPVAHNEKHK